MSVGICVLFTGLLDTLYIWHGVPSLLLYELCYTTHIDVWRWIECMREKVCDLERRVRLAKSNVEKITAIMAGWSVSPLYQRKEDKKECLLGLEVIYLYTYVHGEIK